MVGVDVRQHDRVECVRAMAEPLHVGEQHRAVGAGVEQQRVAARLDEARKPPARREAAVPADVVEHDGQAQALGLAGGCGAGCGREAERPCRKPPPEPEASHAGTCAFIHASTSAAMSCQPGSPMSQCAWCSYSLYVAP